MTSPVPYYSQLFTNNAIALLDASISAVATSFTVQAGLGALFPQPATIDEFFLVTLEDAVTPLTREIIKCSARTGDTITVAPGGRGWEGTPATAWAVGTTIVDHRVTAGTLRYLRGNFIGYDYGLSVAPTVTQSVDSMDITGVNQTCKWFVTIKVADGRLCMFEVIAVYRPAPGSPSHNIYAHVGDPILHGVNVLGTPTDMILQITNNDVSTFTSVDIIRMQHYV